MEKVFMYMSDWRQEKSGRPKISTERNRRELCRYSKKNPFSTAINFNFRKIASISTIKNYLRQGELLGRIAAQKHLLTKLNIKRRITWCKDNTCLTIDEWKTVPFTDEYKIEMFSVRREFARRLLASRFNLQFICKTLRYPFSILGWDLIKKFCSRFLIRFSGISNISGRRTFANL